MRKWIPMLLCLLLMSGCSGPQLERQTFTVELGQDVYANAALYIKNPDQYPTDDWNVEAKTSGVIKKENRFISKNLDYLVVGQYDFEIDTGKTNIDFAISIKDTQAPTIESYESNVTVKQNESIDWSKYIEASDLSGVSFAITSDFDNSKLGIQDVTLRISDRFGNAAQRTIHVTVIV